MKQLFIGAEGTLGIVTGVSILTAPRPRATNNMIIALPFKNVKEVFAGTKRSLSEILSAFEFIDRGAYDLAVKHGHPKPFRDEEIEGVECFVLIETHGADSAHDEEVRNQHLHIFPNEGAE